MAIETLDDLFELYKKRFKAEKAEGLEAIVQFNITGEGGGKRVMTISDKTLQIETGEHNDPSITVTSSFDDWMDMNLGKANPMVSMMTGKVKVSGSLPMAMKFQSLFFSRD